MNLSGKFNETWVETSAVVLLLIGFLLSILLFNATLSYLTIFLSGLLAGRVFYVKRFKQPVLPLVLMILGFLVGYLLGGFWVSRGWVIMLFLVAFGISYYLHLKKIVVVFEEKGFIK